MKIRHLYDSKMLLGWVLVVFLLSVSASLCQELTAESTLSSSFSTEYDPMTSNYAPDEENQSGEVYIITDARLNTIRKLFMYPYYDKGGNANNSGDYQTEIQNSATQVQKNLNFRLPFFGFRYNYTRVTLNGYLEFSDPPEDYTYPLVFPIRDWPKINDPSFIGVFFSKCKTGSLREDDIDQREPGVYFRVETDLRTRTDRMGVEIRERLKWDIRDGIIGASDFEPNHLIIVTWKNISFAGGLNDSMYKTNTFQLVLATDEIFTYAMFNYLDINWTSHTEAGGDVLNGDGGVPAFVGFNAGNSTRSWEYKPYSQSSAIRNLSNTGFGNSQMGRHYFRIDESISLGSCTKDIYGAYLDLVFAPSSGNMLGGSLINVTGPCFEPNDVVTCKFNSEVEVPGVVIDTNRAMCVQPPLSIEGYVRLEVKIDSEGYYRSRGTYYVETPATATEKIFFSDMSYMAKNSEKFEITWDKHNLTLNENDVVSISLWGYRESGIRSEVLYINDLDSNIVNSGSYNIYPLVYQNRSEENLNDIQFGFIQINLTKPILFNKTDGTAEIKITPALWSRPIPLAWYFAPQWERKYGSNWPETLCNAWKQFDQNLESFTTELPKCPCTLEQALASKGSYMPDLNCDKESNPKCYLNRQALHCVKTGLPASNGGEQQCCYDKNHYLMLSQDQEWGSNPRRSHNWGYTSSNGTHQIPSLSQWFNDIMPKFVCCLWQDNTSVDCETYRYENRPTQDCVGYQGPGTAGVFGDPHIITFDNLDYTFNAKGEFVLVRSQNATNSLDIQGRFEQLPENSYGEVKATKLTSIVARGNSSTIVEIRQRPPEARWRYHLDVFVNARRIYFDRPSFKFQHFSGVTVYTPTYIFNQSEVIVMFDSGAAVEVVESNGYLTTRVYIPHAFFNQTRGLLGNWTFNIQDDFILPNSADVPIPTDLSEMEQVYVDFGIQWMINDTLDLQKGASLFYREYGKTASHYNDQNFIPEFRMTPEDLFPPNRTEYLIKAYELCDNKDYDCIYDFAMTYNSNLALLSKNDKTKIEALKEINNKTIVSCGVLKTPRFGRKSTFLFVPGTIVDFECIQDYVLVGDTRRECLPEGRWSDLGYGFTECLLT